MKKKMDSYLLPGNTTRQYQDQLDEVVMEFDDEEGLGQIRLERGLYGAWVYVDGKLIGLIDLFHLAPAMLEEDEAPYIQFVIQDRENTDSLAFVRWKRNTIEVLFDRDDIDIVREHNNPRCIYEREPEEIQP